MRQARKAFYEAEAKIFAGYGLQPRSRFLPIDDPGMHVRAVEFGDGQPVLFLHGFSLCTAHWAPLIARLPEFRCVAIDMPGHGGSDAFNYDGCDLRQWYRRLLTAALDHLGWDSAHVVGHSQGAMLGLFLALDAPERVRSLVTIGTPAVAFGADVSSLRLLARRGIGPVLLGMPKPRGMYRRILASTLGEHDFAAMPAELIQTNYLATRRPGFGDTVASYLREMFRGVDSRPQRYVLSDAELGRIKQRVLVLLGEHDGYDSGRAEARRRVALMPEARFEIVPGDHEPWLSDGETCAALISRFMV